jgi:hypothetical protein
MVTYRKEVFMEELHERNEALTDNRSLSLKPIPLQRTKRTGRQEVFSCMTPAEHLDEARRALADGYKVDANPVKTIWGRVGDARKHLEEIQSGCPQYKAAQSLLHATLLRERRIDHMCLNVANQVMVRQREMLAHELEQHYKGRGLLIDIELSGPDKTLMKLMCPVVREAAIDKIADETNFFDYLKEAGFKRVVMYDIEENVWSCSLEKLR